MIMREALASLLADETLPNPMPDVDLLRGYLRDGCPHGDPICLSFGETWSQVASGLVKHLDGLGRHAHGYQLSMYGLPALRRVAGRRLVDEHGLAGVAEPGRDFEVAISWTGTRSAMFDFGRYLVDAGRPDGRTPVAVVAGPSWDYHGVFEPLGFRLRSFPLRPERGFVPDAADVVRLVEEIAGEPTERLALVVVNAQHNPTAVNWPSSFVGELVRVAAEHGAAILLDDAYFAVHDTTVTPTSALRLLLEEFGGAAGEEAPPWLAVRSLGKQFHCNGWGIGTLVARPDLLEVLVNRYRLSNSLMYSGVHQQAMAGWLADPASDWFLADQRAAYTEKRALVGTLLQDLLGYPADQVHAGDCTSYLLFELPPTHGSTDEFRRDCFERTGVLLAPAWPWPYRGDARPLPYLRMFLGPEPEQLTTALKRMAAAGLTHS